MTSLVENTEVFEREFVSLCVSLYKRETVFGKPPKALVSLYKREAEGWSQWGLRAGFSFETLMAIAALKARPFLFEGWTGTRAVAIAEAMAVTAMRNGASYREAMHQASRIIGKEEDLSDEEFERLSTMGRLITVQTENSLLEGGPVFRTDSEIGELTIGERNALAEKNGWCQYYHDGETPFLYRGEILVHVAKAARDEDSWRHNRPFQGGVVTEARHAYNQELEESEWDALLDCLNAHWGAIQPVRLEHPNRCDTAGSLEVLDEWLQEEAFLEDQETKFEYMYDMYSKKDAVDRNQKLRSIARRKVRR